MIKYSTKKTVYTFSFSLGLFMTFLAFAITSLSLSKISGATAVICFLVASLAKREMKKHFWLNRIALEKGDLEAPYMFTWFWLSWVVFIFGDFVPLILYGLELHAPVYRGTVFTGLPVPGGRLTPV